MTDSEKHRPGVSLKLSSQAKISDLLKQAREVEQRLEGCHKSDEDKAGKLRRELCTVLSDMLLHNPLVALQNDCCTRLWNSCFYKPVCQLRGQISRAKRKKDPHLKTLHHNFKRFLIQGSTLYDYLIEHYQTKLFPDTSQTQDSGTQESTVDSVDGRSTSTEGVVENLYRFYIHLGDLHRYGESFDKAETCYLNASKLAPGKGNPYNQLAVIVLSKENNMSCLALYWYARSLLATHQSFETANGNLDRLFSGNKSYLTDHSRDATPPIFLSGYKSKTSTDLLRAQKAAASKSCLAHFVDVHYYLFESIESTDMDEEALRSKMSDVMASLESLLKVSAFGDALLCKIVAICTFMHEYTREERSDRDHAMSRDLLFMTGATLANRLKATMPKIMKKEKPGSIRLLLPYQILCEFLRQLEDSEGKDHDIFWQSFSEIANLALDVSRRLGIVPNSYSFDDDVNVPLKEYQLLQGFKPFNFLYQNYTTKEPFIDPDDAIDALDLATSQSQEVSNSVSDENKTKLARFLVICNDCAENEKVPVSLSDGKYSYLDRRSAEESNLDELVDMPDFVSAAPEDEDDAGDVVVFQAPEEDSSEGLLPSALEASATKQIPPQPQVASRNPTPNRMTAQAQAARPSPPAAALLPPPGFAAPMNNPITHQVHNATHQVLPQQYGHLGVYGQVVQGQQMLSPTPPNAMMLPTTVPVQGVHVAGMNGNLPFGNAWQVFGGGTTNIQTANPFAGPGPVTYGHTKAPNSMFEDQPITTEGTSLLDSALIDSLFMNDTKTNNPWK